MQYKVASNGQLTKSTMLVSATKVAGNFHSGQIAQSANENNTTLQCFHGSDYANSYDLSKM